MIDDQKLIIQSPLFFTGYGNAGWGISYEMKKFIDVVFYPILATMDRNNPNYGGHLPTEDRLWLKERLEKKFDKNDKCLKIWHQFDLAQRIGTGEYIAFPFFELDTFSEKEKDHLHIPDKLIVSCEWAKQILIDNNIKNDIHIANLAVDLNIFDAKQNPEKEEDDPYIFMNAGKWEVRKGHDILLEMFENTFGPEDNVELWVAASSSKTCFTQDEIDQWHNYYGSSKLSKKIKIIPRVDTQKDLATIMSRADCGIFPSRAEGWNLDMLEMMALDKAIITTNYSAHTEFCNKNNSFLVDLTGKEPAYDGKWFFSQGNWGKITQKEKDQFCEFMRHVYKNKIRKNPEGLETARALSWTNAAKQCFEAIYGK
jgi:glycosyltransferase involved in cell wall biosynthesis